METLVLEKEKPVEEFCKLMKWMMTQYLKLLLNNFVI